MKHIVVAGGGAAGLMAAIAAAESGAAVTLLEKNEKTGKKIYITGKGRCNLTNACPVPDFFQNVPGNSKFLYSAVHAFSPEDTWHFFEDAGLPLKVERGNRVFPVSDKSSDVIRILTKECKRLGVNILLHAEVKEILREEADEAACTDYSGRSISEIRNSSFPELRADAVIIATGGLSYPSTGSTGDGYRFAKALGHTVSETIPSLVPILLKDPYVAQLEGLSLRNVAVRIAQSADAKPVFEDFGELVFTDRGVSGPVILTATAETGRLLARSEETIPHAGDKNSGLSAEKEPCSDTAKKGACNESGNAKTGNQYKLFIDLKPALDKKALDQRILRDFSEAKNREFKNSLQKLLPAKMIPVIIALSDIVPEEKVNNISKAQRMQLADCIKNLEFTIERLDGFEKAVITKGGVNIKEINPKTMESRKIRNLFFAGEVLDVDALTGGFNLQIAFSTGHAAGLAAAEQEKTGTFIIKYKHSAAGARGSGQDKAAKAAAHTKRI